MHIEQNADSSKYQIIIKHLAEGDSTVRLISYDYLSEKAVENANTLSLHSITFSRMLKNSQVLQEEYEEQKLEIIEIQKKPVEKEPEIIEAQEEVIPSINTAPSGEDNVDEMPIIGAAEASCGICVIL